MDRASSELPAAAPARARGLHVVGGGPEGDTQEGGAVPHAGARSDIVAAAQLRAFIERVERLQEERQTLSDDIAEVYAEAKGSGFDTKAMRAIVRLRGKDPAQRQEEEAILDLYKAALGML